jgi:predicted amidohydrolase
LDNQIWLSLGSFPETCEIDKRKHYQTHFIVDQEGNIHAKYRKIHLFEADLSKVGGIDVHD